MLDFIRNNKSSVYFPHLPNESSPPQTCRLHSLGFSTSAPFGPSLSLAPYLGVDEDTLSQNLYHIGASREALGGSKSLANVQAGFGTTVIIG